MKKVSVVIPTYNREKCVIDLINCLFRQDYDDFEIIVIDQSEVLSKEKFDLINCSNSKLKYYKINERGRSLAKNYGINLSNGDIVIFCDDDIIIPENFISTHVSIFEHDKNIGAASCRLIEDGQPTVPIKKPLMTTFYGRLINKPYSTLSGYVTSLNGGNMSFRRDVLFSVGFFEEYFAGTSMVEEPDIAYRILKSGYKLFFCADITVFHYPQHNGNIAEMRNKRSEWFYSYFYNLCIFYLKYGRFVNMPFVFCYCVLLSTKHVILYRQGLKGYLRMVKGFIDGARMGLKIFRMHDVNVYYTPPRKEKYKQVIVA